MTARTRAAASARDVALAALERVDDGAYANLTLPGLLRRSGLSLSERAAATDLVYGSLRMRAALDFALAPLSRQPLERLEPLVLRGLRLGAYELLFGGTAAHAAVAETVGAVARAGHRGQAGYVNAVLRRLAAVPPTWPDPDRDPAGWATTGGSHPAWIVDEALARLGPREMVALVEADNTRPEVSLRATPGRTTRDQLLAELAEAGVPARPSPLSPDCVTMERGDPARLAAVAEGRAVVQDAASALVAPAVGAAPGDLVADLAAGPGGKAGHLAALGARVLAVEVNRRRARLVAQTAARIEVADRLHTVVADGRRPPLRPGRRRRRPGRRALHQPGQPAPPPRGALAPRPRRRRRAGRAPARPGRGGRRRRPARRDRAVLGLHLDRGRDRRRGRRAARAPRRPAAGGDPPAVAAPRRGRRHVSCTAVQGKVSRQPPLTFSRSPPIPSATTMVHVRGAP